MMIKAISAAVILLVAWILTRVNHLIFKKAQMKWQSLHLRFFERIITAILLVVGIILALSVFGGIDSVWKTLLGGTAIVSAVLAFAAQDAIKDILAGLMISIYKPFEIGSRIELEDGTAGVVKDITMRHVVLATIDTQQLVIPNSRLNAMSLRNNSYRSGVRAILFRFHIGYGSDVKKAMEVIRQAVESSPYSMAGKQTERGMEYGPVYFLAYEDSSLQLATTVYYSSKVPSEVVLTDINLRVGDALKENGIEIPFNYINVVQKES